MDRLKILYVVKESRVNKSGKALIVLRASINSARTEISTKEFIEPAKWNQVRQEVKGNTEAARLINNYLHDLKSKVIREFNLLVENQKHVEIQDLKNALGGKKNKVKTLIEVFEENNLIMTKEIGSKYTSNTVARYKISITRLKAFLEQDITGLNVELNKLDYKFIKRYENFLFTHYDCHHNTIMKYLKHLKKVIHQAMSFGYIEYDPFLGYKTAYKEVNRGFLTQLEIDKIESKSFAVSRLEETKDIFIFACYTGISFSDLYSLSTNNIHTQIDGSKVIILERKKTRVRSVIPLLDKAKCIVEKYANHPLCSLNNTILPMRVNQKINSYLKEIAVICEIEKNVTMHLARHTFATTVALSNDVALETVQKMLGHKSIQTTQIYSRTLDTKVVNDMSKLNDKLLGEKAKIKKAN